MNQENKIAFANLALKHILLVLLISLTSFSEVPYSGIFIVSKPEKKRPCGQELKMLIGEKKICILKRPIINIDEFEYLTDILYDPIVKLNYIKLGLSSEGVNILNQTNNHLLQPQFALVIENDVICIFTIQENAMGKFLRIGFDLDLQNLIVVHQALKKINY